MKNCKGCKWANWQRTAAGRVHPSGDGKCTFPVKPLVLPMSVYGTYYGMEVVRNLDAVIAGRRARAIDRKRDFADHCATYQPEEPA